jgi:thiamine biosynthesis lipoprotein
MASGMRLDLGGIGMGYAIDRALEVLRNRSIAAAMVDASGDIGVSGPPPGSAGWRIEVAPLDPTSARATRETLVLANAAVTTSGDARQGVEIDGIRYSHIVDPRTGVGVIGPAAVTVIAADCSTADALATAASVLGPEEGLKLVAAEPGAAARFVWLEAGAPRETCSSRWPSQSSQPAE